AGMATLTVGAPAGFSMAPDRDRASQVKVQLRRFEWGSAYIGKDRVVSIGELRPLDWSPLVRVVSSDATRVQLSLDPKNGGIGDVVFTPDPKTSTRVYAHGIADNGTP